jgi:hypothetical protein
LLAIWGAGELLAQQARQEQQRAAWPVTRHDLLGLPGGVAGDQDDTADGLAADLSDVVLEEAVVAVVPCTAPSNSEPSTVASSARLSSHAG